MNEHIEYLDPHYTKFIDDMESTGYAWEDYSGRYFYHGPAVRTDEENGPTMQEVISATTIPCQWDNMGYDYIVYPK